MTTTTMVAWVAMVAAWTTLCAIVIPWVASAIIARKEKP